MADDVLLDAARSCVLAVGVRRTTLAEIARTARVSRMTVYRRFPDVRSVLAALMTREFSGLLRTASEGGADAAHSRARLVLIAAAGVRALSTDPLFRTLLDVDPELVLPYIVERLGATQKFAEQALHALLDAGHRDGSIRRAPVAVQSRSVLLVVQSFAFSLRPATVDVDEAALMAEFTHVLDAALRP
ncbi:TetR family transcriptional regulator [Amycolatopsis mediterranei S699]|uniref:TetR family transcriptional regulator n=2 Tax=Amycolatopsis mediterranei TaxID=33910 RepID=A0A0H3DK78_AMYMU|nr:TetR/AcrR family transcriptional regulator [Amycolatopsis mediterranei]ADJ50114.1 TetR family transcriptional regulator [Amycolatopsis mediterranei U32]AEK47111.1 TetR family transcriptional regulator [Amycolatopsis mediterranei S699]AFO81822.1 TetR family transcriptional regulator [Amycolatopsis mediterranei S699]AGT88951.1 TetR family transcriptional regulator [Amycolatopsis mediterranei RB]KDO07637.1 TetR family transcriptional regulator [Amycolatopsis mediterranei]